MGNGHGRGGGGREPHKSWMSKKRKLQKELRETEKFSCLSKEVQESQQHDLMSEYQKVLKISQKIQSIQDKRRKMQKESAASQEEMLKIREEIDRNEERFRQLSDKVDKYIMVDAAMAAELQGLKAGEERRGSNASQAVDCCMETMLEQFFAVGADQARSKFDATHLLRRCQKKEEEEGIVRTNKSKAKPVSSWRCQRQAGAMKALQRVVWSLIFLVFGVPW